MGVSLDAVHGPIGGEAIRAGGTDPSPLRKRAARDDHKGGAVGEDPVEVVVEPRAVGEGAAADDEDGHGQHSLETRNRCASLIRRSSLARASPSGSPFFFAHSKQKATEVASVFSSSRTT